MKQSRKSAPAPELAALRAELRDAQSELALAYRQFDQATAPELVEACIYRISAAKARCDYYLRVLRASRSGARRTRSSVMRKKASSRPAMIFWFRSIGRLL